jgi:hypothetical protein
MRVSQGDNVDAFERVVDAVALWLLDDRPASGRLSG